MGNELTINVKLLKGLNKKITINRNRKIDSKNFSFEPSFFRVFLLDKQFGAVWYYQSIWYTLTTQYRNTWNNNSFLPQVVIIEIVI